MQRYPISSFWIYCLWLYSRGDKAASSVGRSKQLQSWIIEGLQSHFESLRQYLEDSTLQVIYSFQLLWGVGRALQGSLSGFIQQKHVQHSAAWIVCTHAGLQDMQHEKLTFAHWEVAGSSTPWVYFQQVYEPRCLPELWVSWTAVGIPHCVYCLPMQVLSVEILSFSSFEGYSAWLHWYDLLVFHLNTTLTKLSRYLKTASECKSYYRSSFPCVRYVTCSTEQILYQKVVAKLKALPIGLELICRETFISAGMLLAWSKKQLVSDPAPLVDAALRSFRTALLYKVCSRDLPSRVSYHAVGYSLVIRKLQESSFTPCWCFAYVLCRFQER